MQQDLMMSVRDFYDALADDYHLIFADWHGAINRQGNTLDELIRRLVPAAPDVTLYDCSCGIGTQAIGLAKRGYTVHATDLSPVAVERAKREAQKLNVSMTTGVADFRHLGEQVKDSFDVVISCDNSLPHLLTDADLQQAAHNLHDVTKADGLLLISIRDYDHLLHQKPRTTPVYVYDDPDRRISFHVWDWQDDLYTINHYIITHQDDTPHTVIRQTQYRALKRETVTSALENAGFRDIRWHMPEASGYYQPIVTAHA